MKKKLPNVKTGAVIYTRVSSDRQVDNMSLGEQLRICKDFCKLKELTVIKEFTEEGESAKTADRTELQELLKFCLANRKTIGHLVVYKVDRFSRKVADHSALRALLKKLDIILWSASEPIDSTTTGMLLENVLASFAQFDNDVRSERSRGGMVARVKEGCWVSKAPAGYINIKDVAKRPTLAITTESAEKLFGFFSEFATGNYTQTQAVELAHKHGICGKGNDPISRNGTIKLLRNPVYAGYIQNDLSDGVRIKGIHTPVITLDHYLLNQSILDGKGRPKSSLPRNKPAYPLRGFLICGICNKPLTASASKGRTGHFAAYHCTTCTRKATGNTVRIPKLKAHEQFEALLAKAEPASWVPEIFKQVVLRRWNNDFVDAQLERRKIDQQLKNAEDMKNSLMDKFLKDIIPAETYQEQESRLAIQRVELEVARNELKDTEARNEQIVDQAVSFLVNLPVAWRTAELNDQQRFQNAICEAGIVVNPDKSFGTAILSPILQETSDIERQYEANKKDPSNDESLVVTPRGIEPLLPG
ncbi:MAG: Site-specific recombinase [Candidatus Saccharibacteria bacterium]|nr:Site-specific recombinase [Candidatus Saccharibacteria bacterium]